MNTELQGYRASKKELLDYIVQFNDEQLNKPLSQESWSVLQVCHHLLVAEELFQKMIESRKTKMDGFGPMKFMTKINYLILWVVFLFPNLKFKAPDFVAEVPEGDTLDNLLERWAAADRALEVSLKGLTPSQLTKAFFTHPALGRLNASYMLSFSTLHVKRHFRQVRQILKAVS